MCCRRQAAPVIRAGRRPRHRPGRQRHDRLHRRRQRRRPRNIIGSRDGLRQTVVDLMQLVRQIEAGIDVDGDGSVDLDAQPHLLRRPVVRRHLRHHLPGRRARRSRPACPTCRAARSPRSSRLSPVFRALDARWRCAARGLLNRRRTAAGIPAQFNENIPLRDQPPLVNTVAGAMAIQQALDRNQWVQQSGNPVSYAPYIRKQPLPGNAAKPVIVQFAKGDRRCRTRRPARLIRAGDLADRATFYRNDLAFAANPATPQESAHVPDQHRQRGRARRMPSARRRRSPRSSPATASR